MGLHNNSSPSHVQSRMWCCADHLRAPCFSDPLKYVDMFSAVILGVARARREYLTAWQGNIFCPSFSG